MFVERGFLVLQGQQADREIRLRSAERVSLFVRTTIQLVTLKNLKVFLLNSCLSKHMLPVSGHTVCNCHCRQIHCVLWAKDGLHRSHSNRLHQLLHWGSSSRAQREVMQHTMLLKSCQTQLPLGGKQIIPH